jgi:hypothetical protein
LVGCLAVGALAGCLVAALVLVAAARIDGGDVQVFGQCDPAQPAHAERLRTMPTLTATPQGVESRQQYSTLPCQDEDGVGVAGWSGQLHPTNAEAVREYYRTLSASEGWVLKGEYEPPNPEGLDLGYPDMCFQSDGEKGVILSVSFLYRPREPVMTVFVEAKFANEDLTCAPHFQ